MLLPNSASNPASMMAQALTIYKSLIGNSSGGVTREITQSEVSDSGSTIDSDLPAAEHYESDTKTDFDVNVGEPVFSLQNNKKGK